MAGVLGQTSGPPPKDGISNAEVQRQLQGQGVKISASGVHQWRLAGMPSRDPGRMEWIKANRPKLVMGITQETEPRQELNPGRKWKTKEEQQHYATVNEKYKALRQRQNYENERGKLVPSKVMFGVLRQHFRDSRTILMNLPDTLAGHITDMDLQVEIREAAMTVCSDAVAAVVHAITEAVAAVGLRIKLDDDRNQNAIPVDDETAEDDAA